MSTTPEPQTFDMLAAELMREAIQTVLVKVPELRSVAVVFDYRGPFNGMPGVHSGIWLGTEGRVTTPEAVLGSLFQTIALAQEQLQRAYRLADELRQGVEVVGIELVRRHEELQQIEQVLGQKQAELGQRHAAPPSEGSDT